jgi:gentisate 1,2-dioxygenase
MPAHPRSRAVPHLWRWERLRALAAQAGDICSGQPRRRAPGHRAGQPLPRRPAVRHPDAVGGDPVPHAGRGRAGAPAHPARVPLRRRGRGRVDGSRRRPGADAPRRLPAAGRLELARPPQRHEQADGLDRRPGHPVPVRHRGAVLRVRPRRDQRGRADHAGAVAFRAPVGTPGPAPAAGRPGHARQPAAGLPLGVHRPGPGRPARPGEGGLRRHRRARPRRGPLHRPATAPTSCRPSAPSSTGSPAAPRPRPVRETGSSVYQVFDGSGTVTVATRPGR